MKTKNRPMESHTQVIQSFLDLAETSPQEKEVIHNELTRYIERRINNKWCHPIITKFHTDWYREFYRLVKNKDPYKKLKEESNNVALQLVNKIPTKSFKDILLATIIGNKIDFGACTRGIYNLDQLEKDLQNIHQEKLVIDDSELLDYRIQSAKNILFLADNNGEIIFDTLLFNYIRNYLPQERILIAGKETPMLNDVTYDDLKRLKMHKFGKIISIGSNCFGLHEEDVSKEFKEILKNADLIIAKGQAYLEFFSEYNFTNVFNILRVKHRVIGNGFGVLEEGGNAIISSERYAEYGMNYIY